MKPTAPFSESLLRADGGVSVNFALLDDELRKLYYDEDCGHRVCRSPSGCGYLAWSGAQGARNRVVSYAESFHLLSHRARSTGRRGSALDTISTTGTLDFPRSQCVDRFSLASTITMCVSLQTMSGIFPLEVLRLMNALHSVLRSLH